MIIVEGMDNSGKSTLATRLAYDLQGCVIANKRKPQVLSHFLQQIALATASDAMMPTILDRVSAISEPVYGILRTRQFELTDLLPVWMMMGLVVYCRPPLSVVTNFGGREQMAGVIEQASKLYDRYDLIMERVSHYQEVIEYDYTKDTYQSLKEKIDAHQRSTQTGVLGD